MGKVEHKQFFDLIFKPLSRIIKMTNGLQSAPFSFMIFCLVTFLIIFNKSVAFPIPNFNLSPAYPSMLCKYIIYVNLFYGLFSTSQTIFYTVYSLYRKHVYLFVSLLVQYDDQLECWRFYVRFKVDNDSSHAVLILCNATSAKFVYFQWLYIWKIEF